MTVELHFLLLAIGEILKVSKDVTPTTLQNYIRNDDAFGVRPPLAECRLALSLMESSGFIVCTGNDIYEKR